MGATFQQAVAGDCLAHDVIGREPVAVHADARGYLRALHQQQSGGCAQATACHTSVTVPSPDCVDEGRRRSTGMQRGNDTAAAANRATADMVQSGKQATASGHWAFGVNMLSGQQFDPECTTSRSTGGGSPLPPLLFSATLDNGRSCNQVSTPSQPAHLVAVLRGVHSQHTLECMHPAPMYRSGAWCANALPMHAMISSALYVGRFVVQDRNNCVTPAGAPLPLLTVQALPARSDTPTSSQTCAWWVGLIFLQ